MYRWVFRYPLQYCFELVWPLSVPADSRGLFHVVSVDRDETVVVVAVYIEQPVHLDLDSLETLRVSRGNVLTEIDRDRKKAEPISVSDIVCSKVGRVPSAVVVVGLSGAGVVGVSV